ncbi:uncharacterized protein AUP68_10798 [Ilyonectria robusta]
MKVTAVYSFALVAIRGTAAAISSAKGISSRDVEERQLIGGLVGGVVNGLDDAVSRLLGTLHDAVEAGDIDEVLDILRKLKPTKTLASVEEASAIVKQIVTSTPSSIVELQGQFIANGVISGTVDDLFSFASGLATKKSGHDNVNPNPPTAVYPKAAPCDAPYSTSESDLRSAIFIPDSFTYGEKPPVILFPGTGLTGCISYAGKFIPLLSDVDWADPVWVNVPGFLLDDAQVNAEYAAYALNYIASLTGRDVSIIAWSQGTIDTQWALKYWPSTREITTDLIAISGDYKGTVLANVLGLTGIANDPSVLQQAAGSDFITTLRSDDGGSGYIPTTNIYSGFLDEIVQPQSVIGASIYLLDARGVGVTNSELQVVCQGQPAGTFYTHESILVNPLTFALAKDALTHDGPGEPSRLDLTEICSTYLTPGLGLGDFLLTETSLLIAVLEVILYAPKSLEEPDIMPYATAGLSSCS